MLLWSVIGGMTRLVRLSPALAGTFMSQLSLASTVLLIEVGSKRGDIYNILWALVFGFATLNILSLVTRRFEPNRHRMSMGELMAVGTVVVAIALLGLEMLSVFKILPLKLPIH